METLKRLISYFPSSITLKWALKTYLKFAILHTLYKVIKFTYFIQSSKLKLKNAPGYSGCMGEGIAENIDRLFDFDRDHIMKYPDAPWVWAKGGPGVRVFANTPDAVRFMLKEGYNNISKPRVHEDWGSGLFHAFVGKNGIFAMRHGKNIDKFTDRTHEMWFNQRKIASRIFSKNTFNTFMKGVFVDKIDKLETFISNAAKEGREIDIQKLFFSMTMNSIQKIFFDREVDTILSGGKDPFGEAFDTAHRAFLGFVKKNSATILLTNAFLPFPFDPLVLTTVLHFSRESQELFENSKFLRDQTQEIVRKARDHGLSTRKREDLLSRFLEIKDDDISFSDEELCHIILHFILAGRDTTACTLTWLFFELTQNPDVQELLFQEIDAKISSTPLEDLTYENLSPSELPYLNGVIHEALRLHPPVPEDPKRCTKDTLYVDPKTGLQYIIPKGAEVLYSPFIIGRNENVFKDAMKFEPKRWIPFSEKKMSPYEFPVFQAGYRECLGKDMALFEAKLVVIGLIRKLRFTMRKEESEKVTYALMLTMAAQTIDKKTKEKGFALMLKPELR